MEARNFLALVLLLVLISFGNKMIGFLLNSLLVVVLIVHPLARHNHDCTPQTMEHSQAHLSFASRGTGTAAPKPHSENQRYIHDIEQANAMRRRKVGALTAVKRGSASSCKAKALSLGLRGLDEADTLREEGHAQCALGLYQSAIEVLLRLMRDEKLTSISASLDKSALEERVRLALSDAEGLKGQLKRSNSQHSTAETSSESPLRKRCFTATSQYVTGVGTASATSTNAMRRRKVGAPTAVKQGSASSSKAEALSLGLRGLDEADTLREEGHAQCALGLYQSAIEVLLRLMLDEKLTSISASLDKSALEERVRLALSDAEGLKGQLKRSNSQHSMAGTSSESPLKNPCFTAISQNLTGVGTASATSTRKTTPVPKPQVMKIPSQAARPPPHTSPSNRSLSTSNTNRSERSNSTAASQGNQPTAHAKENQALDQAVLDDMYLPTSQLQSTTWNDIAGLATAKQALQEAAIMPLLRPELFTGLRKPQNILLYGPPGTGKTMLVKAVAYESQSTLFNCTASSITSKWLGDGEKLVRALFRLAAQYSPAIIFIDDIDAIASERKSDGENEASRRLTTEIMQQMDGIKPLTGSTKVLAIACTNCPWDVDSAILRRFSRRIFVPLPDKDARKALLKHLLDKAENHSLSSDDRSEIVKRLKGFSGSDIQAIASEASFRPLRSVGSLEEIRTVRAKDVRPISVLGFNDAIDHATKSVTKRQLEKYDNWNAEQGG